MIIKITLWVKKMLRISIQKILLLTLPLFLLQGCISTPHKELADYAAYPTFELQQPVSIDADSTRVFLQNGQAGNGFNHFEQHCRLEVKTLKPIKQILSPDIFKVTRVQLGEEMIAASNQPLLLARLDSPTLYAMGASDNEPPETMDLIHFYLHSERQPDVYRLTCAGSLSNGSLQDYPRSIRPDANKINEILGDIGVLEKGN